MNGTAFSLIFILSTLFGSSLRASEKSRQFEVRYVVYSNDLVQYRNQSLSLELHLCDEGKAQCFSIGKSAAASAPTTEKAFMIECIVSVSEQVIESTFARLKTSRDRARLVFDVRANNREDSKLSFMRTGAFNSTWELAKLSGSERYAAGVSKDSGRIEYSVFEPRLIDESEIRSAMPPAAGKRPPVPK